jgi:hypothetical protein
LEHLFKEPAEPVRNGDDWTMAFHRVNQRSILDETGTVFDNSFNKDIRAVDTLIRKHYSYLADGKYDEAWLDFSDLFVQKLNSKEEVLKNWKTLKAIKGCENAPAAAIRFLSQTAYSIEARVDGSQFLKGEKKDYLCAFLKQNGEWKFQSLSLEDKTPDEF